MGVAGAFAADEPDDDDAAAGSDDVSSDCAAVWLYHPYVLYSTAQMYIHRYVTSEGSGRIAGSAAYARLGLRRSRRAISEAAKASVPLLFRMRDVALSGTGWD